MKDPRRPVFLPMATAKAHSVTTSPNKRGFLHRIQNKDASVRAKSRFLRRPWYNDMEPSDEEAGYPKKGLSSEVGDSDVNLRMLRKEVFSGAGFGGGNFGGPKGLSNSVKLDKVPPYSLGNEDGVK